MRRIAISHCVLSAVLLPMDDVDGQKCQEMKKTMQFVLDLQLNLMFISIVCISINDCNIVSYNVLVILLFCIS